MKKNHLPDDYRIEPTQSDKILETIALISLVAMIALPILYWNQLPEKMPIHFGATGKPDAWAGKASVWLLPAVGVFVYLLMTFISKKPSNFNYPTKVTPENAERKYRDAVAMIRWMKVSILVMFVYMVFMGIQTGLGNADGFGTFFIVVFLAAVLGPIFHFGFRK